MRRVELTLVAMLMAAPAGAAHPCARGPMIEGMPVAGGTADGFRLQGDARLFALAHLAAGRAVPLPRVASLRLFPDGEPDRYDRQHVHAFGHGGSWVQGDMLAAADALADPPHDGTPATAACAAALLAAEANTVPMDAAATQTLLGQVGRPVLVTGTVASVGDRERSIYLNFGTNWREDFTVIVSKAKRGGYGGDIERLKGLSGRRITVRGTLEANGGPAIRLYDEAHVIVLD